MTEESDKKHKKKHKKNEVSDVGISETELGGSDVRIEGREHLDKEDMKETKNDKRSRKERENDKENEKEMKNDKEKEKEKKNVEEKEREKEKKKKKNDKEKEKEKEKKNDKEKEKEKEKKNDKEKEKEKEKKKDKDKEKEKVKEKKKKKNDKEKEKEKEKEKKNVKEKEKEKEKKNDKEKEKEKEKKNDKEKEEKKKRKNDKELEKERSSPKEKKPTNDSCKGSVERKKADKNEEVRILVNMDDRAGNANEKLENKKRKRVKDNGHLNVSNICDNVSQQGKEVETVQSVSDLDSVGKVGKKKRKRETSKGVPDESASCEDITQITETGERDMTSQNVEHFEEFDEGQNRKLIDKVGKKKKKRKKGNEDAAATEGILAKKSNPMRADSTMDTEQEKSRGIVNIEGKSKKMVEDGSQDSRSKKKSPKKKVSFSPNVEVFPSAANGTEKNKDSLIRGKRFTKEEDELVRQAVYRYIEANCLGEEGLDMVLNCQSEPRVKNCWKEIATCIPYRPYEAIYFRAHILFKRGKDRKWTEEEYKMIREFHDQHGPKWKVLADELGKHMWHVKDTWRRIKLPNLKKGRWDQEELQNLFNLVNEDLLLRVKLSEERKTKYGMLRDNISWSAISDRLTTRSLSTCCHKWYEQLSSPMVAEGKWADTDDYRLIDSLYKLDASCIEDVDWDNVVDRRSGDVCLKRWKQMVLHIGQHSTKPFTEQVELLASRYCPDLVDARVAWDNKPLVD